MGTFIDVLRAVSNTLLFASIIPGALTIGLFIFAGRQRYASDRDNAYFLAAFFLWITLVALFAGGITGLLAFFL